MSYQPVDPIEPAPVREPSGSSWTGFAAVKYGFIFLIVVAILYVVAAYLIPALSN